ncbi:MAG TPA: phosphoserine phosphatase SerB [Allosphingosinicella sp.]|jgi:phosphoserine phosphatase
MFIATLVAAGRLSRDEILAAADLLDAAGVQSPSWQWLEEGSAADLRFDIAAAQAPIIAAALEEGLSGVDVFVLPDASRRKHLLVADMDSTMITVECIDELADYAGVKAEVAEITERAMRGELAFEDALRARVALLKGLEAEAIDRCRTERVRLTPGARTTVGTMRREGALTIMVSGGFTRFADPVGAEIGFERVIANRLVVEEGRLTGAVEPPIVGAEAKRLALIEGRRDRGLLAEATMAVGDGANDIPMICEAAFGVSYRAKPAAAEAADARIRHNDLTALLYAQGYRKEEWAV